MIAADTAGDSARAGRLQRMQWLATGLLALMALIFVLTSFFRDDWPLLAYAWAFSEAALIGGLADWFAVTALFRRPLGLPIPHTAIVPNRKDEIGRSLARFIADHFLVRSVLEKELGRLNLAQSAGRWLSQPANAAGLGRDLARALGFVLADSESGPLREAIGASLRDLGRSLPLKGLIAAGVDVLASGEHAQLLIDKLVDIGRDQLERNKALIRERIRERSPWWLPRFVDEQIFDQLVAELERILGEVGDSGDHPARHALVERLREIEDAIENDPSLAARTEALRDEFLAHPAVARFGRDVAVRSQAFAIAALEDPESDLRLGLERQLMQIGRNLAASESTAARLDEWLAGVVLYLVETYRDAISSIVSTTVTHWDANATARRIELQIGRDLQFIRINGTLVGGLVGLVLYLSWTATIG